MLIREKLLLETIESGNYNKNVMISMLVEGDWSSYFGRIIPSIYPFLVYNNSSFEFNKQSVNLKLSIDGTIISYSDSFKIDNKVVTEKYFRNKITTMSWDTHHVVRILSVLDIEFKLNPVSDKWISDRL